MRQSLSTWPQFLRSNQPLIVGFALLWALFALMEMAGDWHRLGAGRLLPHVGQALFIFLPWVGLSVLAGRLSQCWPLFPAPSRSNLLKHFAVAIGLGGVHLLWVTASRWIFWPGSLPVAAFPQVALSYGLNWFHFELLVYFAVVFLWSGWFAVRTSVNDAAIVSPKTAEGILLAVDGETTHRLLASDIVWLQADNNYVLVHCKQGVFRLRSPLKSAINKLSREAFFQTHRSAVVRIDCIDAVESMRVVLNNRQKAPLSRRRRAPLITRLAADGGDTA